MRPEGRAEHAASRGVRRCIEAVAAVTSLTPRAVRRGIRACAARYGISIQDAATDAVFGVLGLTSFFDWSWAPSELSGVFLSAPGGQA